MAEELSRSASEKRASSLALAEHATLWTLLATVTLFTAGQISHSYELDALGIRGLRVDVAWQDRVFEGGIAILNMFLRAITEPHLSQLPWLGTLALFGICLWRRKATARPRAKVALGILAGCAYLATLIILSILWGRVAADFVRTRGALRDHFVFTAESAARLPPALLRDNDRRALRLVTSTSDFVIVLSGDTKTVYRIATRDIELQDSSRETDDAADATAQRP